MWIRSDGSKEVISGRHRLDLARRSGEETIPAQYHYESQGFGKQQAAALDAILNIREGQGKVKDYVDFIQATKPTQAEADAQGILARATGRRAYTIADSGTDTLITAHRANQLTDEAATRIAAAAPNNEALQAVGIKAVQDGKTITVAENMVKAVKTMTDESAMKPGGDMFGFDDSALKEAEALARKASAKQAEIQRTLSAVQGAAKNPELAAKEGVDVKDPEAVKRRIAELKQQKQDWQNWHTNPELTAQLRGEEPPVIPKAKQESKPFEVKESAPGETGKAYVNLDPTHHRPTLSRPEVGAGAEHTLGTSEKSVNPVVNKGESEKPLHIETGIIKAEGLPKREAVKNARAYAKDNFAGSIVTNTETGHEIIIPMSGIRHTTSGAVGPDLLETIPYTPDILEQAHLVETTNFNKGKPDVKETLYLELPIEVNGKTETIRATVFKRHDGKYYYDHAIKVEPSRTNAVHRPHSHRNLKARPDEQVRQGDGAGKTESTIGTSESTVKASTPTEAPPTVNEIQSGEAPPPMGTTLYSTPVIPAMRELASLLHLNPLTSVGGGIYGGLHGEGESEAERYSPQWWLDVATYSLVGATGSALTYKAVAGKKIKGKTLLGKKSHAVDAYELVKEKLGNYWKGNKEVLELGKRQEIMKALIERQAEKAGEYLLKNFTPAERAAMADLIEGRGIIAEGNLLHRQAQELDDFIAYTSKKLQELGMLDKDIEPGGYLHRYYEKDLGIGGLVRALTPKGKTLSGSWSIRRGTQEVFDDKYMSKSMRDTIAQIKALEAEHTKLRGKAGDLVDGDTQARINEIKTQLHELQSIEYREYLAPENGTLKSFFLAADEVPVIPGMKPTSKTGLPEPAGQNTSAKSEPPEIGSTGKLVLTDRRWTIDGSKAEGEAILHRDWTKAERESWGEINDAAYRMVRGQAEVAHDLSLGTFFKEVNDQFAGKGVSDLEVAGWEKVPDTKTGKGSRMKKYGALAGKYVSPDIWQAIKHQGRNPLLNKLNNHPAVKIYLQGLGKWKTFKTVYNPVSHMNNAVSNLMMYNLSDYEYKYLAQSFKELRKGEKSALVNEARNAGLFGSDWTSSISDTTGQKKIDELLEKLRNQPDIPDFQESVNTVMQIKQWFIESSNAVKGAKGPWKTGAELAKAVGNPLINTAKKPLDKAASAMQAAYRVEDEFFKMAVYLAERNKGTKPFEAVQAANRYFFDYNDMPNAMKWVRDSPLGSPFISYTYFAIPAMIRTAIEKPEKLFALMAGLEAFNYAAMSVNEELQEQGYWDRMVDENELYPSWMTGRSIWGGLNNVSIPFVDSYKLSLANVLPAGNPFVGNADREGWPEQLSFWGAGWYGSNPMIVLLHNITTNQDWRGNPIWDEGAPTKEKISKAINYIYQNVSPSNPLTPGSYHQQKWLEGMSNIVRNAEAEGETPNALIASTVDGANAISETLGGGQFTGQDRSENEILFRDALLGSIGVKLRPIRPDQFEESKLWDVKHKLDAKRQWLGKKERLFEENRITEKQIEKARQDATPEIEKLSQQVDRIEAAASNQNRALNR